MKVTKRQLKRIIKEELEAVKEASVTHDDYGQEKFTYADPGGMDYQVSPYGDTALKKMRSRLEGAGWSEEQIEKFSNLRYKNFMDAPPQYIDRATNVAIKQDWTADQLLYFFDQEGKYLPDGITLPMWQAWREAV